MSYRPNNAEEDLTLWEGSSLLDAMSHTVASRSISRAALVEAGDIPSESYDMLRRTIDAVTHQLTPSLRALMVAEYLGQTTRLEARKLSAHPGWLRMVLRKRGDALVVKLLKDNWEYTGNSASIREQFNIPTSTLHREKDAGHAIAYRPDETGDFLFPLEQFNTNGLQDWASEVVRAVGNGTPALHFLYTKREIMKGKSFAEALRENRSENAHVVELLLKATRRLAVE